ncbi:D-alanyl-D-alanine carboxypeptidase family protein [Paenibacillus sp. NEAU-GSW1]|uniref:M15 family metallopeptidase n=1 Tax=Paenibacillus sp. NEAU-GSW1 TaxID=2682486 RepID=UPI0012E1117D|nr:M15 family metallopeptidase [Paenibacillus sp. NEAU-GSW1]MUT66598.1 D-alanyl-D-alanine carboxypeptidase family protein [Paenibacillus sp. NEAU-GSW1]
MNRQSRKQQRRTKLWFALVCVIAIAAFLLIRYENSIAQAPEEAANPQASTGVTASPSQTPQNTDEPAAATEAPSDEPAETDKPAATAKPKPTDDEDGMAVIAEPDSVTALVNKQNKLPENYEPADLVYPDVLFTFNEKIDKRKMRKEAATALEEMFDGAKSDGIHLAGVSAYRSHATQKSLFERYVKKDGLEKAKTYSAFPGTSEHETGLAIDVSGSDGKCAASDCFGGTPEAVWLADHADEYGFIIRYPDGKEDITGYKYEPWHLRYVGKDISSEIAEQGITLEEYFNAVPVNN